MDTGFTDIFRKLQIDLTRTSNSAGYTPNSTGYPGIYLLGLLTLAIL